MTKKDDRRDLEIEALRDRLSEVCLRVNESLDMNTVLQEALDSPRAVQQDGRPVSGFRQVAGRIENFLLVGPER